MGRQRLFWLVFGSLFFITAVIGVGVARLNAQAATATVLGTVKDTSGAVVPGVKVDVKNLGTGITQSVITDQQGRYRVADLAVGRYDVQAAMSGFQTAVRSGITLAVGTQSIVDFELLVGQQQQVVTVEGEVSQVQTTNSAVATLTEQKQMKELPLNGRNFEQLIVLAPGVQQITNFSSSSFQGRAPEYSVAGSRPTGQALLLDDENLQGFYWGWRRLESSSC
jgi:hypothetical protein